MKDDLPPRELIIGMDGFIGKHLCLHLPQAERTTRRAGFFGNEATTHYFNLFVQGPLPDADIVYICAGVNGTMVCADNPQRSYKINVDGTIFIAEHYRDKAFVVWIGSTTVQWLTDHYGTQKRTAEMYLRLLPHVGIVRAGRVTGANVDDLCTIMIDIGRNRRRGVVVWGEDEPTYTH